MQEATAKMTSIGKQVDYAELEIPPPLANEDELKTSSRTVTIHVAGKPIEFHVEECVKKDGAFFCDVLFLHGQRFSSQTWLEIKTLYLVAGWGYRAVAIDLPGGKGQTKGLLMPENKADYLAEAISTLGLKRPVIISPSMSGSFSLPYLFGDSSLNVPELCSGYVPVAPVSTSEFLSQYKKSQLQTLIVCGTEDKQLGTTSTRDLRNLPNGTYAPIEGAGHACYMNKPDAFHALLYYFLNQCNGKGA